MGPLFLCEPTGVAKPTPAMPSQRQRIAWPLARRHSRTSIDGREQCLFVQMGVTLGGGGSDMSQHFPHDVEGELAGAMRLPPIALQFIPCQPHDVDHITQRSRLAYVAQGKLTLRASDFCPTHQSPNPR